MSKTKLNKIILNKKGQFEDFASLFLVGIGFLIIFGVLLVFLYTGLKNQQDKITSDINVAGGFFSTRMVLDQDVRAGYKVYNLVADADITTDAGMASFNEQLVVALSKFYPDGRMTDTWLVIVDDKCYLLTSTGTQNSKATVGVVVSVMPFISIPVSVDSCDPGTIDKLPKTTVPNPDGKNKLVVFKLATDMDKRQPRVFGYKAGLLKGYESSGTGPISPNGEQLVKIENIPNVVCDETDTTVGKICYATPALVDRLKNISETELRPKEMKLVITQAYRTKEIQMALYEKACKEGCDCSNNDCRFARNPDKLTNPSGHLDGTAVDAILYTKDGTKLNGAGGTNLALAESIMCDAGFVRWKKETWHFEYGSFQWGKTEEKRSAGIKVCSFPN